MKQFYLATATIQQGAHQYLDAYPLPEQIGKPTWYQCVDIVFGTWFADEDDPARRIETLQQFHDLCYAWLPCGERTISNISYDLDHRRMVEHYFEQQGPSDLASRVSCFPQHEWGYLLGLLQSLTDDIEDVSAHQQGVLFSKVTGELADLMLVANTLIEHIASDDARIYVRDWVKLAQARLEAIAPSLN